MTAAEKGLEVQKTVIGEATVERLYATAPPDQQHIQLYLSAHCFGVTTRGAASTPTRELVRSLLAALGGCDPR